MWNFILISFLIHASENPNPICFPKTNLYIPTNSQTGISEAEFNRVLDKVEQVYNPIFEKHGGTLSVSRSWDDGTINAKAWRFFSKWYIKMYGGLARHKEVTSDGFTLVACHEIGHHLGGFPKQGWYSVEGQSDYFAALKCAHKIWADENNVEKIKSMQVDSLAREKCMQNFSNANEQAICVRSAMGAKGLARMLAEFAKGAMPELNTPDASRVKKTNNDHPNPQCRLDTSFAAAQCDANPDIDVSSDKSDVGVCLFDKIGGRPPCWFAEVQPKVLVWPRF